MSSEPFEPRPEHPTRRDDRSRAFAVLLIGVGVIWLLSNLGAISAPDISQLARLWPLVLVYLGLKQLLGRPSRA